jgi:hypothetical protein
VHYLSFESMRELAQGVVGVIDDTERLNSMQQAAHEKCDTGFDWRDRGRTFCNASSVLLTQRGRRYGDKPAKNAMRFHHLAHRLAAAHKLHSTTATTGAEFNSGKVKPSAGYRP